MATTAIDVDDSTPVLVGVGRFTHREGTLDLKDIIATSAALAIEDAAEGSATVGAKFQIAASVDAVACTGTFFDGFAQSMQKHAPHPYPNLSASVAAAVGCTNVKDDQFYYTGPNGNSPQM
jgi:hypothetical protein